MNTLKNLLTVPEGWGVVHHVCAVIGKTGVFVVFEMPQFNSLAPGRCD